ncbi:MAG: hypothetical protein ACR5K7_03320 [Symbiopectobacterium sp.]
MLVLSTLCCLERTAFSTATEQLHGCARVYFSSNEHTASIWRPY